MELKIFSQILQTLVEVTFSIMFATKHQDLTWMSIEGTCVRKSFEAKQEVKECWM